MQQSGEPFLYLDGTLIRTDRATARDPDTGYHVWYSGRHKAFGGNVQVLADHTGYPVRVSPAWARRHHRRPAPYPTGPAQGRRRRPATLADKGSTGAGIGITTPIKGAKPRPNDAAYNTIQAGLQDPAERANALLKGFKALRKVSLDPSTITTITSAALVILNLKNQL